MSPRDYEQNLNEMIELVQGRWCRRRVAFNELWDTPYRKIVGKVARRKQIPWVDSKGIIDQARQDAAAPSKSDSTCAPPTLRQLARRDRSKSSSACTPIGGRVKGPLHRRKPSELGQQRAQSGRASR